MKVPKTRLGSNLVTDASGSLSRKCFDIDFVMIDYTLLINVTNYKLWFN